MDAGLNQAWDARVARGLARLPPALQSRIEWLRVPSRWWLRVPAGVLFTLGGLLSILPVLGLWMLPVGAALLAEDVPGMKGPLERSARWLGAAWRRVRGRA